MSNKQSDNKNIFEPVSQNNPSPVDFDKQLRKTLRQMFPVHVRRLRDPAGPGAAQPGNLDGERARAACGACPILDTSTPLSDEVVKPVPRREKAKRTFSKTHRRMYSRVLLGLRLPGRYYFLTFTSAPGSPPLEKSWVALRQWLHYYRPGMSWIYCFTQEGHGVIHMIIRLPMRAKNLDIKKVRAYWDNLTGARQIKIKRVREADKENLASYLVNQKLKKKMGREFAYQSSITRWHWSHGWLPKGFTKTFGRLWVEWIDAPDYIRDWAIGSALALAHEASKKEAGA